jgi:hypothetical protein
MLKAAILILGVTSTVMYIADFSPHAYDRLHAFLFKFMLLSVLYFAGVYLVIKKTAVTSHARSLTLIILFFGVLFRAVLVTEETLSSDIYRYVWDGRVQAEGINPYVHPPSAAALAPLRDKKIYPLINRKDYPTIYPAGAQLLFLLSRTITGDSVTGFKGILSFLDVLTMVLLVALLNAYRVNGARLLIYAWNPLVICEIAQNGHLEGLTVLLIVAALYLRATDRKTSSVIFLSLAASIKLYPALLLPAFLSKGERIKGVLVFGSCFAALYLPFISAGSMITGFLPVYLNNPRESFNLGLKQLIMNVFPGLSYSLLTGMFLGILFVAGLFFFFKEKESLQVLRYSYILVGLMIIFAPASLHPWYVIWLVPFLVFYPAAAWLVFSCAVSLSNLEYVLPGGIMQLRVLYLQYIPLYVLLIVGCFVKVFRARGLFARKKNEALITKKIVDHSHSGENFADEV